MGKQNSQREPSTFWLVVPLYLCILWGARVVRDAASDSQSWMSYVFPALLVWSLMWAVGQARRILRWELAQQRKPPVHLTQHIHTGASS